jgi:Rrf2 family protein
MKLSTKARYGMRALIDVALHQKEGPVGLGDIAQRQEVSEKYLEHLFRQLKSAGIVRSVRGAKGGYCLSRPQEEITLLEIINALEGTLTPVNCVDDSQICSRAPQCVTREIWADLKKIMEDYLKSKTLADLVKRQQEIFNKLVYYI